MAGTRPLGVGLVAGLGVAVRLVGWTPTPAREPIRPGSPVRVSLDGTSRPYVEPTVAAHPRDARILVGAAVTFEGEEPSVVSFHSDDGGGHWRQSPPLPGCRIDPWVRFGPDGVSYLSCMAHDGKPTLVFRSPDGGASWLGPAEVPLGEGGAPDRPVLAVAPGGDDEGAVRVHVAQGQGFADLHDETRLYGPALSVSVDGGRSFAPPVFLRHDNLQQQPLDIAVLADGSVAVLFMDYLGSGSRFLAHRRAWLTRSTDGGGTWSIPRLVREQIGREMPWSMAIDPRGDGCGRLYLAIDGYWSREPARRAEIAGSQLPGLMLSHSDDCGSSWSEPSPVTTTERPSNQETPVVAVNRDGVVGVAWYDTRRSDSDFCFDLFFAASFDRGDTFEPALRLTGETSCPHDGAHPGLARRWAFGGDYSGLAAAADGAFHALWADTRTGSYQIWSARIEPGAR